MAKDLFGNEIIEDVLLRDKFIEPPFSVLDTKGGAWQNRKRRWQRLGIKGEMGRANDLTYNTRGIREFDHYRVKENKREYSDEQGTSIFDPALTELIYNWFCPKNGLILDPFAGGSVRGIVAHYLGYKYIGIELRQEQVDSNREQALKILPINNQPQWYVGDSQEILKQKFMYKFDFVFSCPPYFDLEKYSDLPDDLSNMDWDSFILKYKIIITEIIDHLKGDCFACFVVGDIRDKNGYYRKLVTHTIDAFTDSGDVKLYNDAILLNAIGTAPVRARQFEKSRKLIKVHQNVLIFKKVK